MLGSSIIKPAEESVEDIIDLWFRLYYVVVQKPSIEILDAVELLLGVANADRAWGSVVGKYKDLVPFCLFFTRHTRVNCRESWAGMYTFSKGERKSALVAFGWHTETSSCEILTNRPDHAWVSISAKGHHHELGGLSDSEDRCAGVNEEQC